MGFRMFKDGKEMPKRKAKKTVLKEVKKKVTKKK